MIRPAPAAVLLALASALVLAGCGSEPQGDTPAASAVPHASAATLASMIAGEEDLSGSAHLLNATGLIQVFDGAGSYTMLVPDNEALEARSGAGWQSADRYPEAAAILREHILPGYMTMADIEAAIARAPDGSAEMRSLGQGIIRFSRQGSRLVATDRHGHSARIGAKALLASNGVALPLDGVLDEPAGADSSDQ